ncbi:MAG: hypothetical protein WB687_02985, partial [Candidatus Cybelea sp.]
VILSLSLVILSLSLVILSLSLVILSLSLVILSLSKDKRARDRVAKRVLRQILGERANEARAPDKEQHAVALRRRQREAAAVDRVQQVARAPCKGGVRGADVVRNAGATRTNEPKQERFVSGSAPADGIVNEGTDLRGFRHDGVELQFLPGAPAANV